MGFLKKIFGSRNERQLSKYRNTVAKINALEPKYQAYSDEVLQQQTAVLRERFAKGETLEQLLPDAFAVVREASLRAVRMRPFDVQLMGGIVLHEGKISEMHTGEGKTLTAALPAYLNALSGKGVHIVTVNPYLAERDANWMGPIYTFLGLTVGINLPYMDKAQKKIAYAADITYGTNNEFGFDYLRDNMAFSLDEKVQRTLNFAIVDEVDSILIDEARTPLIISGRMEGSIELYEKINALIHKLTLQKSEEEPGDYTVDEKAKQIHLTEAGHTHVENILMEAGLLKPEDDLYSVHNLVLLQHIYAALRAYSLYQKNVHYIVTPNKDVVIVDEHTGRTMPGRRWSEGLHQAIEAKEGAKIQYENQTLAAITFQNYFRLYEKLAGMTGTADTEAYEFQHIYGLEVVVLPTHKKNQRADMPDLIYLTAQDKYKAVIADVKACREKMQPVLVGTASIEASEHLSRLLDQEKIPHQVLNAKFHDKEAQIIREAGVPGTVTIATNMAGRGTDIVLGGNFEAEREQLADQNPGAVATLKHDWRKRHDDVITAGGLHVIGSERHESRRIDNQLRGRSGRQGDPGSTRFYLSMEDDLMRIFASPRLAGMMQKMGLEGEQAISSPLVNRAIESAQRKVEAHNFDIRKQLLEFDDVANEQRRVVYAQRNDMMHRADLSDYIDQMREAVLELLVQQYMSSRSIEEEWQVEALEAQLKNEFLLDVPVKTWLEEDHHLTAADIMQRIIDASREAYQRKIQDVDPSIVQKFEKNILLQWLDNLWRDHLAAMDYLRRSVSLRGFAQKDPKQEYKREAFNLFSAMLEEFRFESIKSLSRYTVLTPAEVEALEAARREKSPAELTLQHTPPKGIVEEFNEAAMPSPEEENNSREALTDMVKHAPKIGRNDPCFCGSNKKYKQCHGKLV